MGKSKHSNNMPDNQEPDDYNGKHAYRLKAQRLMQQVPLIGISSSSAQVRGSELTQTMFFYRRTQ
jgi:hypothetical protein